MTPEARSIIEQLRLVEIEREARRGQPGLSAAVQALKLYQQQRFKHTYADLLETPRYSPAARFFLDELYGPRDFSQRDAQFVRVVPALVRLFPAEIVHTVDTLARLHAVSESLDSEMARHLSAEIDSPAYARAWCATARPTDREAQIALTLRVGQALDHYTRKPLIRHSLLMMRGPAGAAGLRELQRFLETGFNAFRAMKGADDFLRLIGERERTFAANAFAEGK